MKFILIFLIVTFSFSQDTTLFDWNSGHGTTWPGWIYTNDADGYGSTGFYETPGNTCGFAKPAPQFFEKTDYGNKNDFSIDTTERAPSTSSGGSMLITEASNTGQHSCGAWIIKNCNRFGLSNGLTDAIDNLTDRLSMYVKLTGTDPISRGGGENDIGTTTHFGTYLCDVTYCPNEGITGSTNQHYYHYNTFSSGSWVHILFDQHPNHRRGDAGDISPDNDPEGSNGYHYYPHLVRAYFEIRNDNTNETTMRIDEVKFMKTSNMAESNQNDISITNLLVGYFPDRDEWEMNWHDGGYGDSGLNDNTNSTYEVRYSTSPITNNNYSSASIVTPAENGYGGISYTGNANYFRKMNSYNMNCFIRFTLPDAVEHSGNHIYFAVKDVSVNGGNAGTQWPYTRTDGRDASSSYIHTIDYYIKFNKIISPPASPKGLKFLNK